MRIAVAIKIQLKKICRQFNLLKIQTPTVIKLGTVAMMIMLQKNLPQHPKQKKTTQLKGCFMAGLVVDVLVSDRIQTNFLQRLVFSLIPQK